MAIMVYIRYSFSLKDVRNKKPPHEQQFIGGALQGSVDKTVALHNEIISDLLWLHKIGRTQISSYKRFSVRYIGF